MDTITLGGQVFVLIPQVEFAKIQAILNAYAAEKGLAQPAPEPVAVVDPLDDYYVAQYRPPLPLATAEERSQNIRVVEPTALIGVPAATPKPYEYRERFLNKTLTPYDLISPPRFSPADLRNNPETPEIKADTQGKYFYGPGIEIDRAY